MQLFAGGGQLLFLRLQLGKGSGQLRMGPRQAGNMGDFLPVFVSPGAFRGGQKIVGMLHRFGSIRFGVRLPGCLNGLLSSRVFLLLFR